MKKDILLSIRVSVVFTIVWFLLKEVSWEQIQNQINLNYVLKVILSLILSGGLYFLNLQIVKKRKEKREKHLGK